jgi:hypothetical protein
MMLGRACAVWPVVCRRMTLPGRTVPSTRLTMTPAPGCYQSNGSTSQSTV